LHITDTHLKAAPGATLLGVDTAASLTAVLHEALNHGLADAVIASGDLAHDPQPAAYKHFRALLAERFQGPVLHLPGNHDLSAPMFRELDGAATLRLGAWDIIGFDSHGDHRTEACFDAAARRDLERRIRTSQADHVLLVCHHPPVPVGCPWLDKDCIPDGLELLESCAADGRVRGLLFGHVHQQVDAQHGSLAVLGTPSTCFQFEPGSQRFTIDGSEARGVPGYRWLTLHDDGELHSEVRRLAGYPLHLDLSDRS
jgi:3',5'-cyclic-AMP phosphodiesterase